MERKAERQEGYLYLGFLNSKNDFKNREYFHKDGEFFYRNASDKYGKLESNLNEDEKSLCSKHMLQIQEWNQSIGTLYSLVRAVSPEELQNIKTHLENRKLEKKRRTEELMKEEMRNHRIPNPTNASLRERRDTYSKWSVNATVAKEFLDLDERADYGEIEEIKEYQNVPPPSLPFPPPLAYFTYMMGNILNSRQRMNSSFVRFLVSKWKYVKNSVKLEQLVSLFSTYNLFLDTTVD